MAVVDEIAIKLGIQTGDLKAALADADASIKKFKGSAGGREKSDLEESIEGAKKSLRGLKELFVAGGVFEAVRSFFDMAITNARNAKGAIDENFEAVRRFGDGMEAAAGTLKNWSTELLGFFNRAGENIGNLVNWVRKGIDETAIEDQQLKDSAESLDDFNRRLEERKKHTGEIAAAHKELAKAQDLPVVVMAKAQEEERQIQAKAVGAQAELNLAGEKYRDLLTQIAEFKGQEWERDKLLVEVQKAKNGLIQAEGNLRKENKDAAEKMAAIDDKNYQAALEAARNEADAARKTETALIRTKAIKKEMAELEDTIANGLERHLDVTNQIKRVEELTRDLREVQSEQADKNVRLAELYLKGADKLTDVEKEELLLLEGKTTKLKQQAEIQILLSKGVENLTDVEKARLQVLIGQTAEIKAQEGSVKKTIDTLTAYSQTFGRTGGSGDLTKMTDAQLKEREANITKAIADTKASQGDYWTTKSFVDAQTLELTRTREEQNTRFFFRGKAASQGADAALGGVSAFEQDRYNFYLTQQVDLAKDNNQTQNAILATLRNVFPKASVPKGGA